MKLSKDVLDALDRLGTAAMCDSPEGEAVASFLLAWAEHAECRYFDLSTLKRLDVQVARDVQTVLNMLFNSGFPSPAELGIKREIEHIGYSHGTHIAWKRFERSACKKQNLTPMQRGLIALLVDVYRDEGRSDEAIAQRIATSTIEELHSELRWLISFGHMSGEEIDIHLHHLLSQRETFWEAVLSLVSKTRSWLRSLARPIEHA